MSPVILLTVCAGVTGALRQEAHIEVQADKVLHPISRYLAGACIEDVNHEVYGGTLNPSQVWLQPPGYVTQMISRNYLPLMVQCQVTAVKDTLDVIAKRSEDGKTLVLQAVNPTDQPMAAQVRLAGFVPSRPAAQVTELSAPLEGKNPAAQPEAVIPRQREWTHGLEDGDTRYTFPPHSVTVVRLE